MTDKILPPIPIICPHCSKHIENNWKNAKTGEFVAFLNIPENVIFFDGSGRFFLTCPHCQKEFQADFLIDSIHTEDQIPKNSFNDESNKAFIQNVEKLIEDQKTPETSPSEKTPLPDEDEVWDEEYPVTLKTLLRTVSESYSSPYFSGGLLYLFEFIIQRILYCVIFLGYLLARCFQFLIKIGGYLLGGKATYRKISVFFQAMDVEDTICWAKCSFLIMTAILLIILSVIFYPTI